MKLSCHNRICLVGLLFCFLFANSVRANVYATDIRFNGSFKPQVLLPGESLTISYILNDTATGGVWVQVCSGTNVIETFASTNGDAGTNAGLNAVILNDVTNLVEGVYSVSITAGSAGYGTWTNITDDGSNFMVVAPRGVSVNQNTNSPFYGRVFVANAPNAQEGGVPGIFKCNADGSPADEGGFSTGGYGWRGGGYSPWKMAMGPDDRLYVDDFANQGIVLAFDPTINGNSLCQVIGTNNYPTQYPNLQLSGLAFTTTGSNMQIWMPDENPYGSAGIMSWEITSDGAAATNDMGTIIVPVDPYFLTQAPYDLALDTNGYIYTIQYLTNDYPAYALMSFPPDDTAPEYFADWADAMYPELLKAYGVAVDPTASFVAVAVLGQSGDPEYDSTGGLYLFRATNGQFMADLDQTGGDAYYDVAWDNAGNLYALDDTAQVWRVYSPPGANQATTIAVPFIQAYNVLTAPSLTNAAAGQDGLSFTLAGQSNVTYIIQHSCDFSHWTAVATNFSTNASRAICLPVDGDADFYRAVTAP
jgi:hypothetical protein